jgi:hypothetical protein
MLSPRFHLPDAAGSIEPVVRVCSEGVCIGILTNLDLLKDLLNLFCILIQLRRMIGSSVSRQIAEYRDVGTKAWRLLDRRILTTLKVSISIRLVMKIGPLEYRE